MSSLSAVGDATTHVGPGRAELALNWIRELSRIRALAWLNGVDERGSCTRLDNCFIIVLPHAREWRFPR